MSRGDWFRNERWDSTIESLFFDKLRRARRKAQYLRIQANCLTETYPQVALSLLDKYFAEGDHFDDAQAYRQRAHVFLVLGEKDRAIAAYQTALKHEEEFPRLKTGAWLEYALLVALQEDSTLYDSVLLLLKERRSDALFALDAFLWHAARALILSAKGDTVLARDHAEKALSCSEKQQSVFRYHPRVGLVEGKYQAVTQKLRLLCQ